MAKYKLKDVIIRANTKVDKDTTNLIYYVGGEHFTSGDVVVDQRGLIEGSTIGPMFYYGFKAGQFLLVSRNPHLKKAGVVDFDGICSADILTIREIPDKIVDGYLIAVLYSKQLWKFIVSNSTGSLTRRIKWKQLKDFEFYLPPVEIQKRITKVLWAMERVKCAYKELITKTDEYVKSQFIEMFGSRFEQDRIQLSEIGAFTIGLTYKPENVSENGTIVLRSGNIQNSELELDDDIVRVSGISIPEHKYIQPNDILMCSRNGSASLVGKCCLIKRPVEKMTFGAFMTVIRSTYPAFMYVFFQSHFFKDQLTNVGTTSINQITTRMLNNYEAVLPTESEEQHFMDLLEQSDKSKFEAKQALEYITAAQKTLMRQIIVEE